MKAEGRERREANGLRHLGRLFKVSGGREYKPDAPGVKGVFYVRFNEGGKSRKVRLLDDTGSPITNLKEAKAAQWKLRAAFVTDDKINAIRSSMGEVARLEAVRASQIAEAVPPLRIDEAWEKWLATSEIGCGSGSIRNYGAYWRGFVQFCRESGKLKGDGLFLRDITPELARARAAHLEGQGFSGNTVNKHVQFLRSFFNALKVPGRLEANPFDGVKCRKAVANSRRVLTVDEFRKVLDSATGEMHTLFLLGIATGMRLEDCCLLRWDEVDMIAGVIRHRPFKTLHSSGAGVVLGIPGELRDELRKVLDALPGEPGAGYVIPGYARDYSAGEAGKGRTRVCCRIQRHFRSCGIQTTKTVGIDGREIANPDEYKGVKRTVTLVGFHSLRHTWVSLQAMAGTPQAVIQAGAGHSNPAMTEHYTHVSEIAAITAAGVIDATFKVVPADEAEALEALRNEVMEAARGAGADALARALEALRG